MSDDLKPRTVYLVWTGEYEDRDCSAIFDDEAVAVRWAELNKGVVEAMIVNDPAVMTETSSETVRWFCITPLKDYQGDERTCHYAPWRDAVPEPRFRTKEIQPNWPLIEVTVDARTEHEANVRAKELFAKFRSELPLIDGMIA